MAVSMDVIYVQAVDEYLKNNPQGKMNGTKPDRSKIKEEVLNQTRLIIEMQNALLSKGSRMRVPDRLQTVQIARIIEQVELVVCISCEKRISDETETDLIGIYQEDGPDQGIYKTSNKALNQLVSLYNYAAAKREWDEVRELLKNTLPRKQRCMDRDLIPVNNGIFDYKSKKLLPFDKDKVFLSKSKVNYNPQAQNVIIHNPDDGLDWDVESWVAGLSADPGIVNLLWESMGAIVRPFVRWNKSLWLYSESGNSGKGTLCVLMRNLVGEDGWTSIPLSDFSKEFYLETLIGANAIIVDENDVGAYIDRVANLKAVITNDTVYINRKFKKPISYQFFGFMVQCLNEFPKFRDRTNSFYRRQLFVPFDKCYTGAERPYIKEDYLSRPEVLEYVLYKVLNMNYYQLSEPAACREMLEDLKESNDPLRQFMDEFSDQFAWDQLPFTFLFDLYKAWLPKVNPSGTPLGRPAFIRELIEIVKDHPVWMCPGKKVQTAPKHMMDKPEMLIAKYNLQEWMNPNYRGPDLTQICRPALSASYRGLLRKSAVSAGGTTN